MTTQKAAARNALQTLIDFVPLARGATQCVVFRRGAITSLVPAPIPQPHNPNAPLVLARFVLANATSGDTSTRTAAALRRSG